MRISDWSSDVCSSDLSVVLWHSLGGWLLIIGPVVVSQVVFIRIIALIRVSVGVIPFIPIGIVGGGIILAVFDIVFILVVVLGWDVRLAGFGRQRGHELCYGAVVRQAGLVVRLDRHWLLSIFAVTVGIIVLDRLV